MNKSPLISIIIVNYNGYKFLQKCLESVLHNNYRNIEIIIVDNGSQDNSVENIKKDFVRQLSKIKILDLQKNIGPAAGRNLGFKKSKGEIIAFLDNDTIVDSNWITEIIPIFSKSSDIGIIQSKLLLLDQPNKIDYVGEYLGNLGFLKPIAIYGEIDHHQYDSIKYILAAKSAGMFIRRQTFIDSGMFDPDYFIFTEETDLGWRSWLHGYKNILASKSVVYHKFSSTKEIVNPKFNNYLIRFHGTKNYIQTLIKNLDSKNLAKILPKHILLWFCLGLFLSFTGKFNSGYNIFKGILWNIVHLGHTIKKRKNIQKNRLIDDKTLFFQYHLMQKTYLADYINNFLNSQKNISTPENHA